MNILYKFEPTYTHRGTPKFPVPSWGREGWFFTPQCVLEGEPAYDRVILRPLSDDWYLATVKGIELHTPIVRVKSSHLKLGWRVDDVDEKEGFVRVALYLPKIPSSFLGGIFSVAFYRLPVGGERVPSVSPVHQKVELGDGEVWSELRNPDGTKLVLDSRFLWALELHTDEGTLIETAFVDPGFKGTLYVPSFNYFPDAEYTLKATPYLYLGGERYRGKYQGITR